MSFSNKSLSRRQFFKVGGAAAAGAVLGSRMTFFTPAAQAASLQASTDGQLYGVCGVCSMGCAYIAHLKEGRITYLTGNPADQTAQGKLCVKGYSGLRLLYDPDRLKYPMKRTNPDKGIGVDPGWVVISWDEALDLTANKFKEISDTYGPQALMVVARGQTWQKHFANSLGTPNLISHNNTCYTSHDVVWGAMVTGKGRSWTVDYDNSQYILAFGWDGLGKSKNHWGQSVLAALDNGAKLVVFDPRLSITAAKAHEWIPIKPGTDLAALLAMINVIIDEELYDHDFVANYTTGFAELKASVKEYTPDWAAPICEVPAETIARIAREFATTKPAVVASHKRDAGGPNYRNSWQTAACFVIMDVLAGSFDRPGGHILDRQHSLPGLRDVWEFPDYPDTIKGPRIDGLEKFPLTYKLGKGSFSTLAEGILSQKPYPLKGAFFWKHNILAFPNPPRLVEALKTLDFIAVSDVLPTEIVQLADVVLPDNTYFESLSLSARQYHAVFPQLALSQPLPALYETKGFGTVAREILKRMGLTQYVPEGMDGKVLIPAQLATLNTTMEEVIANGGMWGEPKPLQPKTEFGTASKKIELYATALEEKGYSPLPQWQPAGAATTDEKPFHLLIWRRPWHRMTQSQNDPILAQLEPENSALLNAQTAQKLGINEGDEVWVESIAGKIRLKASVTQGLRPDCVAVAHGFGHWSDALSVAKGRGANDGDLVPNRTVEQQLAEGDPGVSAMMEDVVVNVYKA